MASGGRYMHLTVSPDPKTTEVPTCPWVQLGSSPSQGAATRQPLRPHRIIRAPDNCPKVACKDPADATKAAASPCCH